MRYQRGRMMLAAVLCCIILALPVNAEPAAGYHEKVTTEDQAIDTWYGVSRGTYLSYGTAQVQRAGTARMNISGSTNAHSICDELRLALYLDESSDNVSYGTIGAYYYTAQENVCASGGETDIRVTSKYYYRARGVHSVFEGSVSEITDTCTDAITAR